MIKLKKHTMIQYPAGILTHSPAPAAAAARACCGASCNIKAQHLGTTYYEKFKNPLKNCVSKRPPSCDSWDTPTLVLTQQLDCLVSKPSAEKSKDVTLKFCLKIEIPIFMPRVMIRITWNAAVLKKQQCQ